MARSPKWRRRLKWGGFTLCLLVLLTWGASLFLTWGYFVANPGRYMIDVNLNGGVLLAHWWDDYDSPLRLLVFPRESAFDIRREFSPPSWRLELETGSKGYVGIGLPLWVVFVVVVIPTAFLFWRDCRIPAGYCENCGYDLTGNTSGVCPECGESLMTETVGDTATPSSR